MAYKVHSITNSEAVEISHRTRISWGGGSVLNQNICLYLIGEIFGPYVPPVF